MPTDALQLQDRDLAVLRDLYESRVMTTDHATALYFDGNYEPAKSTYKNSNPSAFITRNCGAGTIVIFRRN